MADILPLHVFLHEEHIGTLSNLPGDMNLFVFSQDYIDNPKRPTLSLSFKDTYGDLITNIKRTQTRLPPFFSNLLPEGPLRRYLAEQAGVNEDREFFLLWVLGQDLPGAVRAVPENKLAWPEGDSKGDSKKRRSTQDTSFRFSLAGVQLKFSAVEKATGGLTIPAQGIGGSWIVKLPSHAFDQIPENEYAMMEMARQMGIEVPKTQLVPLEDISGLPEGIHRTGDHAFAIQRFDRSENQTLIHTEDFAQVFGVYPNKKCDKASYRNIAEVLWAEMGETGTLEFVRRFVYNALIGNGDMHLKNWSLIYKDKSRPQLSPAYDFVSTVPYMPKDQLALNFVDSKEFRSLTKDLFRRFAAKARLPEGLVLNTVEETVQTFEDVWKNSTDLPLSNHVRTSIQAHLEMIPFYSEFRC